MQNTVRWPSDWLDGAVVGVFLGTSWSNKSEAYPLEEDNPQNLLFSSRIGVPQNIELVTQAIITMSLSVSDIYPTL